ncbi:MAG: alkaline phosphatase family protein [Actinomycetota bacterium]
MKRAVVLVFVVVLVGAGSVYAGFSVTSDGDEPPASSNERLEEHRGADEQEFIPRKAYLKAACELPPHWVKYIRRGWDSNPSRDLDLVLVPYARNYVGSFSYTPHSGPYGYLQRIPMIWYGPNFIESKGRIDPGREVTIADIAATQAELLNFDWPATRSQPPMTEVLKETDERPRLLVTVSIDGGGINALEEWPHTWPTINRLMNEGTSYTNAVVGSSPSITPAVHTSISTGVFARFHGVTSIAVRQDNGDIVGGFARNPDASGAAVADPRVNLDVPTLPDLWDRANGNEPIIAGVLSGNYAMGMVGFGAAMEGGDKDILAMHGQDDWGTNDKFYKVPDYFNNGELAGPEDLIEAVDRLDGKADDKWRGHDIPIASSPVLAPLQNRVMFETIDREGMGDDDLTDLLYVQYKSPDAAGHKYNMIAPEQGDVIESVDTAIDALISFLDETVGADGYAMVITADHGQTPLGMGGWPINRNEVVNDIHTRFSKEGVEGRLVQRTSSTSFFMHRANMKAHGVTPEEISSFLTRYTIGDNIPDGEPVAEGFEDRLDERIFAGVFPGRDLTDVVSCTNAFGDE